MHRFLFFLGIFLLFACKSVDNNSYSNVLQGGVGHSEYQLYSVWGNPNNVFFITPDKKMISYIKRYSSEKKDVYSNELYYQGMGEGGWWNDLFGPPKEKERKIFYCKTNFVIQRGVIIGYNFSGDDCVF